MVSFQGKLEVAGTTSASLLSGRRTAGGSYYIRKERRLMGEQLSQQPVEVLMTDHRGYR